jgi:hypothetical protein
MKEVLFRSEVYERLNNSQLNAFHQVKGKNNVPGTI